jgi:plasmid stabilization system protein ParE
MQIYEVRISQAAYADMDNLRLFLDDMLSEEGAIRYANNMRAEIKMLAVYADCYGRSTSLTLRRIHPNARKMVSHNRKWLYVYHVEDTFVIVDRILPVKMDKG